MLSLHACLKVIRRSVSWLGLAILVCGQLPIRDAAASPAEQNKRTGKSSRGGVITSSVIKNQQGTRLFQDSRPTAQVDDLQSPDNSDGEGNEADPVLSKVTRVGDDRDDDITTQLPPRRKMKLILGAGKNPIRASIEPNLPAENEEAGEEEGDGSDTEDEESEDPGRE